MFAIEPFTAMRQVFTSNTAGGMNSKWERCRVLGVTANAGDAPVYIIEVFDNGESYLTTEETLRRPAPTA